MSIKIRHHQFGEIDTGVLEERMAKVDWKRHPGHWLYSTDDPADHQLAEMRSIEKELDKLMRYDGDERAVWIWDLLLVKYFSGTPMEYAISQNVPYLEASFTEYHELTNHNMNAAINYYELRNQLVDLGFTESSVIDQLRNFVSANDLPLPDIEVSKQANDTEAAFTLFFGRATDGQYELTCIDCSMDNLQQPGCQYMQYFMPDVTAAAAMRLLELDQQNGAVLRDTFLPLNLTQTEQLIHSLNTSKVMNTQNVEFLKKSLLNLGFGEQVNKTLEKNISKKVPEFALAAQQEYNQQKVNYQLHFKAGDDMYFFNKFDATIREGKDNEQSQTFYINKGNGITAKEAFNLMEGRAVHKQLFNKDNEKYYAWLQLDNDNLTQNGNKEIKRFNENYGFDLNTVLQGKGIKELQTADGQEALFKSLKKGNMQQITVERDGSEKKYYIAASPQFKTVDLYDHQQKKIKREELLQPKQANNQKESRQQKEGLPEKKQESRKRKVTV